MSTLRIENSLDRPLGDSDIVRYALDFAHGVDVEVQTRSDPSDPVPSCDQAFEARIRKQNQKPKLTPRQVKERALAQKERTRDVLRQQFRELLTDPDGVVQRSPIIGEGVSVAAYGKRARIREVAGGIELLHSYDITDAVNLGDLALVLLLDVGRERPLREALCECKLKACGRLFLAEQAETGRPKRLYCCTDHMEEAHREGTAARVARFRARQKAKASARKPK